jgi:hypothetical protein
LFVLLDERLIEANCLVAGHRLRRHPAFLIGRRAPRCPFTGSAGLLGASAYWERQPTGSAGLLGAPAFQPASPDAGSMPASGDLAVGTTWRVLSRMFISDRSGPGLKSFAISYVFGAALSRAKHEPARKPALPVRRAKAEPARKPAIPVRRAKHEPARKPALPVRGAKHEPARKPALPVRRAKEEPARKPAIPVRSDPRQCRYSPSHPAVSTGLPIPST